MPHHRWIAIAGIAALIAGSPSRADAQFTTYIAPPNKVKDSVKAAIVAEQKAQQDSATRAQVADMKTWVDSASGVVVPTTLTDSTRVLPETTTSFTNGSIAPSTASPLPTIILVGGLILLLGAALLRRPEPAEEIARRHRR